MFRYLLIVRFALINVVAAALLAGAYLQGWLDAVVKGAGGSINFNPDYILEALRQCDMEQVRLDMSDDSMPAKFTLGESFTYVVMPISGA